MIDGDIISIYRHPIRKFDFTEQNGKEKWTFYTFVRNVQDTFVPLHLKRICSAVDQVPELKSQLNPDPDDLSGTPSSATYSRGSAQTPSTSRMDEFEQAPKKPRGRLEELG